MTSTNYLTSVQEILAEKWKGCRSPLCLSEKDLSVAIEVFTKLAVESDPADLLRRTFSKTTSLSTVDEKVRAFAKAHWFDLRCACETGFPFSRLERSSTEKALKNALENRSSIVACFMAVEGTSDEMFQGLNLEGVKEACSRLAGEYQRQGNKKSGYSLLWLIQKTTGCNYQIPDQNSFDENTVREVLSNYFNSRGSIGDCVHFVELLLYQDSRFLPMLYERVLNQDLYTRFLNFALAQLKRVPMEQWIGKDKLILTLLEGITDQDKRSAARELSSSSDEKTAKVGRHLLAAFNARSLREALPHFYELEELLPCFNDVYAEMIFGRIFIDFCKCKIVYKEDPTFTRRLQFNEMRNVFVHGSLMIGGYDTKTSYGGKSVPPHLLAFDKNTQKMVWGVPLCSNPKPASSLNASDTPAVFGIRLGETERYKVDQVGDFLTLIFNGEKKLRFLDSNTGELLSIVEIPEAYEIREYCPDDPLFHLSSEGYAYQVVTATDSDYLIAGVIAGGSWRTTFTVNPVNRYFVPLSTHCGFREEKGLVVFSPSGNRVTFNNSVDVMAKGDQLYQIEIDPENEKKRLLTVRTLKLGEEVVSEVEKKISLNVEGADFGAICENGQVVLYAGSYNKQFPVFVDLKTEKVSYSNQKLADIGRKVINKKTGEVWSWNYSSKKIYKTSFSETFEIGELESTRGFLHVDDNNQLYFI